MDETKTTGKGLRDSAEAAYTPQRAGRYTYADYCAWDDGKRWELIDGEAFVMEAPSRMHQGILMELSRQVSNFLRGHPCKVFAAPFDVRLNAEEADDTVVQPDLLVVCDGRKLADGKCCKGAPDFAVEILSPTTAKHDRLRKFNLYLKAGVQEYWIVDPDTRRIDAYVLQGGRYAATQYADTGDAQVHGIPGLAISLADVFAE